MRHESCETLIRIVIKVFVESVVPFFFCCSSFRGNLLDWIMGKLLLSKVVLTLKMYLHDPVHHFIILLFRISGSDDQLKVVYLVIKDTKDITCVKTLLN